MGKVKEPALSIYTSAGWVNYPAFFDLAEHRKVWLFVLLGPRQVGKTYGINWEMLSRGLNFIYLRRTDKEFKTICASDKLNPFNKYKALGLDIGIAKSGPVSYSIGEYETTEKGKIIVTHERGVGLTLANIASIRGFDGAAFTDIVFDEFIPEKIVIHRKAEGDAMLNAYTTINGNRELEGKPPLRLWLLANAFDITNPILDAFGLVPLLEKLMRTGKEYTVTDTGICLAYFKSKQVIDKRRETALMRHLATSSSGGAQEFLDMALNNEFAYDNLELVKPKDLRGWIPHLKIAGLYMYRRGMKELYLCRSPFNVPVDEYGQNPTEKTRLNTEHIEVYSYYNLGRLTFDSVQTMVIFRKFMELDT